MTHRAFGGHDIDLKNLDKVLFPDAGLTKGELIDYYERVADVMLPHLRGRPLSLERYPDGVEREGFYQKQAPDYFPDWIARASVSVKGEAGSQSQIVCENEATLVYLANQACITPHVWLSRRDRLDVPDRMVFDLDPPSEDFAPVRSAARVVRERLSELGLDSWLMLTGSKGAHVVVPLRREADFDRVRTFAQAVARVLSNEHPEELTVEQRKNKRADASFSTRRATPMPRRRSPLRRARPPRRSCRGAARLGRDRDRGLTSTRYTMTKLLRRLAQKADPWANVDRGPRSLGGAERALRERRGRAKE